MWAVDSLVRDSLVHAFDSIRSRSVFDSVRCCSMPSVRSRWSAVVSSCVVASVVGHSLLLALGSRLTYTPAKQVDLRSQLF